MIKKRVIFYDDEPKTNQKLMNALIREGYEVVVPKTLKEAFYEINVKNAEVLVHCGHSTKTHWEICEEIFKVYPHFPSIHIAIGGAAEEFQSQFKGPFHQKLRPLSPEKTFLKKIRKLFFFSAMQKQNLKLKKKIELYQKLEPILETNELFDLKQKSTLLFLELFKAQNVFYFDQGEIQNYLNKETQADVIELNQVLPVEHKVIVAKKANDAELESFIKEAMSKLPAGWESRKKSAFSLLSGGTNFLVIPICSPQQKRIVGHAFVINPENSGDATINSLIGFLQKIIGRHAEHILSLSHARDLSYIDDLTDLYNQRYLRLVLDKEINRSQRAKDCFSVLFMDIDHFKRVNDTRGHIVGSKVLIELSKIIHENIRTVDYGFRYGGDEFLVILIGSNSEKAKVVAERMRSQVENSVFEIDGVQLKVTLSIGIASFPEHATTKEQIIELADKAMYVGKKKSRNIVYVAS